VDDEESKQKSIECDEGDSPGGAPVHQWVLQNIQHNDAKHISKQ
jgi:hypothetical protein